MGRLLSGLSDAPMNKENQLYRNVEAAMKAGFPVSPGGYFGTRGQGRNKTRNISAIDPIRTANKLFQILGRSGVRGVNRNGHCYSTFSEGSTVTMREISGSEDRSPAVDIELVTIGKRGIKSHKIHFVIKEQK